MKVTIGRKFVSLVLALLLISTGLAPVGLTPIKAAEYDLTTDTSVQQVAIEGAIWTKLASSDPTGSGIFESFLRVQKNGVEKGYNTDYRPLQFDENSSAQFTRSFKLADVPQVKIGETIYREFQLDINQQSSRDPEWYISLDKSQVWLTDNPNLHGYDTSTWGFPSGAVKVYDLGDNSIKLDYRTNPGSGKRDYRVLVPESMFAGKTGEYVVLFTQHGATYEANDGYEEWGVAIKNALIEGYKWNDMNGDGVWDAAEPGLNGWTINLSGAVSTSTLTHYDDSGKAGYYSFSVAPGSYTVSEVEQAAWMQTYPVGDSYSVTAGNGAVISGLNFGNMQPLPGISVTKTGDQLSKVGDEVTYTVEIENTGNVALTLASVADTLKGDITSNFTSPLGVGEAASYSYTYTVPNGAADPLLNEVAVNAHMVDHSEIATSGSSSHSVELFQPSFEITKSGPSVVMIGSMVTYTYTIKNNSSTDSPKLVLEAINDDVLGDLSSYVGAANELDPGEEVTFTAEYKVTVAGTLTNVVTATYGVEGFPNKLVDSAEHTLFVADPKLKVTKTGDQLSKVGDEVTYTVEIENTGNVALTFDSVADTLKGDITSNFTSPLGVGEAASYSYTYTVPNGAADPLLNEVAVNAHMVDHVEIATSGSSSHSVELFQPSFEITKSGPSVVMIGSMVTYTYTIKNNSSIDSPKLVLEAINDDVLGDLSSYVGAADELDVGEEVTFTADYKVTTPGTLTNVVTATYGVEGFPNKLVDSDEHTLFVADPKLKVTKTGDQLSKAGDEVTYTVEIENTGNVALTFDSVIDTLKGDITSNFTSPLGVGEAASYSYTYTVPDGAADPLLNEVAVNAHMVDHAEIATSGSSSHSVELFQPSFEITKSGPSVVMIGSMVTYTYTIKNNSSIDSPKLVLEAINDDVLGDLSSYAPANLNPGEEVTFTAEYKVTVAGTLTNVVTATYGVEGFPNKLVDSAEHTLFVADPNTVVTATAYTWETYPGGNVSVTIMERNTGNIDLENVSVSVFDGINTAVLDCHSVGFSGDDGNCILNKGETWSWAYQVTVYADTTYVVTGYGEVVGLEGVVVTYPAYPSEQTTFKVKVVGTTRTQGFWKTHTDFTKYVFENYAGSYIDLGWKKITNIEDLMGMFWADNAKKSDGHKRSQLDQVRMIASQQAIAAVLNSSMPGGAPLPGGLTPAAIATIMGGTDVKAIKDLGSTLGSYNESGDGFALDPSLLPTGKATPNFSRQIANIPFAD